MSAAVSPYGYALSTYHCLLDEQPHYLAPPHLFAGADSSERIVSPTCSFAELDAASPLVLVGDPGSHLVWPYSVGYEYNRYLSDLASGRPLGSWLPCHAAWVLEQAGILVAPDALRRRYDEWLLTLARWRDSYRGGYVNLAQIVPAFHLGALRRYFRWKTRTGRLTFGDGQVDRRHVAYNEEAARFLHWQVAPIVSAVVGRAVKPSYTYLAVYESGSVLDPHLDREQCEYSVTVCIDATPEPLEAVPWPIELEVGSAVVSIRQWLGDGLLYRGRRQKHSRSALSAGHSFTALLLHYVDADFMGSLA